MHSTLDQTDGSPLVGGPSAHLRTATTSFVVLSTPAVPGGPRSFPTIAHWGARLPDAVDLDALGVLAEPPRPHSAPDFPLLRSLVPLGSDGWRLRPVLRGGRPDSTAWSPAFEVRGQEASERRLVIAYADADAGLALEVSFELTDQGVLLFDQRLTNTGDTPYRLDELASLLPLPARATQVLDLTGRWCRERAPQRVDLAMGAWVREGRRGRTGHDTPLVSVAGVPGFGFATGEVWGVHLGWSGDSVYRVERSPDGSAQLGAAERLEPGEIVLAPGASYTSPTLFATYSASGLDGLSAAFHDYVRARPVHPRTPRPVLLNTWEAVYFDHRLDRLSELADAAAALGVERFVLDDGWFGGRRDDTAGLGDWYVSPEVWPDGLGPLIDHVRGVGMEFGLWVEPEMVNPDSDVHRAHPDWVLRVPPRTPPVWRNQQVLDLGNAGAYAYLLERLDALLSEYDIAYLKWDHNRDLVEAGHAGRPGLHAHTTALYRLLDELRSRHPGVEIETCASGGGRVDLGILARTDRIWASDTNDAHERQHIQRWTGLLVPPELVGAHVGARVSHTTGRSQSLAFRCATALFGHFGLELDVASLPDDERSGVAEAIAAYKRWRPLLHSGRVVRLDLPGDEALAHGVVAGDGSEALFSYAQLASSPTEMPPVLRLRGLDPGASFRVRVVEIAGGASRHELAPPAWTTVAEGVVVHGAALAEVGVRLPVLVPEQAILLHAERVDFE